MGSANNLLDHRQNSDMVELTKQAPKSPVQGSASDQIQNLAKASGDPQSSKPIPSAPCLNHKSKLLLQDWEIQRKEERENVELYRTRCTSDKTELYQLVGFYAVFQGVVFNTVATSNWLTCKTSALPAWLCILAFAATAVSVHYKLTDYEKDKRKLINSEDLAQYAKDRMRLSRDNGDEWNFETYTRDTEKLKRKLEQDKWSCRMFYRIVMLFLVVFSGTILACCIIIRCL